MFVKMLDVRGSKLAASNPRHTVQNLLLSCQGRHNLFRHGFQRYIGTDTHDVCSWYYMAYEGLRLPDIQPTGIILPLSVDHYKGNGDDPSTCWIDCQYILERDFAVTGRVFYSDTDTLWVPGVNVSTVFACGGEVSSVDITDEG